MVEMAEIFRVNTSINNLSEIKFSNIHLAVTKSYESAKLSKMLIFSRYLEIHKIQTAQYKILKILVSLQLTKKYVCRKFYILRMSSS